MLSSIAASITPIIAQSFTTLFTGTANQNEETENSDTQDTPNTGSGSGNTGTGTTTSGTSGTSGNTAVASKNTSAAADLHPTEVVVDEPAAEPDADALRNAAIATQNKLQNDLLLSQIASKPTAPSNASETEEAETETANPVVSAYMEYAPTEEDQTQKAA